MRLNEPLSYKEVCAEMNDTLKSGGRNRKIQLERWRRDYEIEKVETKFLIKRELEYYEKEKISLININNKLKFFELYEGTYEDRHRSIIYKIILDDKIYIGQTQDLYERLRSHYMAKESYGGKLLRKGGKMYIIQFTEGLTKPEINKIERKLIKQYELDENWFCVNRGGNPRFKQGRFKDYYTVKICQEGWKEIEEFMNNKGINYEVK